MVTKFIILTQMRYINIVAKKRPYIICACIYTTKYVQSINKKNHISIVLLRYLLLRKKGFTSCPQHGFRDVRELVKITLKFFTFLRLFRLQKHLVQTDVVQADSTIREDSRAKIWIFHVDAIGTILRRRFRGDVIFIRLRVRRHYVTCLPKND